MYDTARAALQDVSLTIEPGDFPSELRETATSLDGDASLEGARNSLDDRLEYWLDAEREDILDAMRKRHSYGATDNIVLDFRVTAGGKEFLQGLGLNGRVMALAGVISLLAAVLLSLPPSLRVWSSGMQAGLAEASRGSAGRWFSCSSVSSRFAPIRSMIRR